MTVLAANASDVIRDISPKDQMFDNESSYFEVGQSALDCIRVALRAASLPTEHVGHILDLPCGHGRVLRYLKAAFPLAGIAACDLHGDAVNYCAEIFGATAVYSDEDPAKVPLEPDKFDLIWVGSLLTHLDSVRWPGFLELFRRSLRPGGVVVFTTHGRIAYDWLVRGKVDYLPSALRAPLFRSYEESGFGYGHYPGETSYGVSFSRPDWVFRQIEQIPQMRLVYLSEAAWARHHDVYGCVRDPQWQLVSMRTEDA
jgi:SAM-dependent methyltransferase